MLADFTASHAKNDATQSVAPSPVSNCFRAVCLPNDIMASPH